MLMTFLELQDLACMEEGIPNPISAVSSGISLSLRCRAFETHPFRILKADSSDFFPRFPGKSEGMPQFEKLLRIPRLGAAFSGQC